MDRAMLVAHVARRQSEGADDKTIYCELRSLGVEPELAIGFVQAAAAQANPDASPEANLASLYRTAAGVGPDPAWIKVLAVVVVVLCVAFGPEFGRTEQAAVPGWNIRHLLGYETPISATNYSHASTFKGEASNDNFTGAGRSEQEAALEKLNASSGPEK